MNFIFTADWHLKTKFKDVPISWLADRYIEFLHFLDNQRKQTNSEALVIGGDVFDRIPSMFDIALFCSLFHATNFKEYIIYPGNHEMLSRKKSFYESIHKIFSPYKQLRLIYEDIEFWNKWCIIPYPYIKNLETLEEPYVMSHVRCASDRGLYDAEIDFNLFNDCNIVLVGDIHEQRTIDNRIFYPGSPMDTAFSTLPLSDNYILFYNADLDSVELIPYKGGRRLIRVETTKDKFLEVQDRIERSSHYYDISVKVDSIDEVQEMEKLQVKAKIKFSREDSVIDSSETEEEQIFKYLVSSLKMKEERAADIVAAYVDL